MKKQVHHSTEISEVLGPPIKPSGYHFPRDVEKLLDDAGFQDLSYQEVLEVEAALRAQHRWKGILAMTDKASGDTK